MNENQETRSESKRNENSIGSDMQNADRPAQSRDLSRRRILALFGSAGAISLGGCDLDLSGLINLNANGNSNSNSNNNANTNGTDDCDDTPALTEGPYFVDERLNRADIRTNPADGVVSEGVQLTLAFTVSTVDETGCTPLQGAQVDVWHCDAMGDYSDEAQNGTAGKKFLRGYLLTDANGKVEFITIYPGWYTGRTVHIHFKVRIGSLEFTSQLFFDESVTNEVYSRSPYNTRGTPNTSNARDGIFRSENLVTPDAEGDGYAASFNIGIQVR